MRQMAKLALHVIHVQKGIVTFIFANYLDKVLVCNYAMGGFKKGEMVGTGMVPAI